MGSGCACQSSIENDASDRIRLHRQGNLSFYIHGNPYKERLVSGKGCKKTAAWQTSMTREEIDTKIKEFWETRVEGSPLIWTVLQQACDEPDSEKAETLVKTYGLTLPNGLLQQTYDAQGYRYDLPAFVINQAVKYGESKSVPKLVPTVKLSKLDLLFRAAGKSDVSLSVDSTDSVIKIKEKYLQTCQLSASLRFFFNGRELKDESLIGQSPIQNSVVIQVFIKTL